MAKPELWRNYFDVVILPQGAVRDHAISLSQSLRRYETKFVLGRRQYIPHISLYHIPVAPEHFDLFSRAVEQVAQSHRGGELTLRKVDMPVLMTDKPAWLKTLHVDLVDQTMKYFDRTYGSDALWRLEYLPTRLRVSARRYLKRYGSPLVNEVFRPHITLTTFENTSVMKTIPKLEIEPMTFHVDRISICELGPSHSCQRIITTNSLLR